MIKNNKTEREIFAQIKQSLDSYEADYIPGSWENFLQKRKDKKRKLFLRIASGVAACLLAVYAGSNFIHFEKKDTLRTTNGQITNITRETPDLEKNSAIEPVHAIASVKSGVEHPETTGTEFAVKSGQKKNLIADAKIKAAAPYVAYRQPIDSANKILSFSANITGHQANNTKTDTQKSSSDTIKEKTTNTFLNAPSAIEDQNLAAVPRRKIRFGINFSPGINSTNSANSLNYMGGVSADIPLFANFQLSTGLQVENQSFVNKFPGIVSSSTAPVNQTRTKLINLDLPVNITWKFVSEKSHSYYVSAGLSSMVYLRQENKNTNYSQLLVPVTSYDGLTEIKSYNLVNQVSVTQNTVTPPQTFDFAGRINFMVGFEKQLSSRIYIHFEPYAKIPSSWQAPGNLNHTTTGINFKISF